LNDSVLLLTALPRTSWDPVSSRHTSSTVLSAARTTSCLGLISLAVTVPMSQTIHLSDQDTHELSYQNLRCCTLHRITWHSILFRVRLLRWRPQILHKAISSLVLTKA